MHCTAGALLPPITRMLLCADGSTTRLLEALLGETLSLNLIDQHRTTADHLPLRVRDMLACEADDKVIRRRSVLQIDDARPVSRNDVTVVCHDAELTSILTDSRVPIGHGLAASRRILGRTVLSSGWATWGDDTDDTGGIDCAYKEYILMDQETKVIAHVHERFNPAHVPSGAIR